jgi:hypothetical protein
MSDEKNTNEKPPVPPTPGQPLNEGYQPPRKRGYQPGTSNLNPAKPPQGGSGVPPKPSGGKGGGKK